MENLQLVFSFPPLVPILSIPIWSIQARSNSLSRTLTFTDSASCFHFHCNSLLLIVSHTDCLCISGKIKLTIDPLTSTEGAGVVRAVKFASIAFVQGSVLADQHVVISPVVKRGKYVSCSLAHALAISISSARVCALCVPLSMVCLCAMLSVE